MSNCQGEDDQFIVFDETDDSIVSYSISPLTGTIRCQSFAMNAWITASYKIFFDPRLNHSLSISVQFFEFPVEPCCCLDFIAHISHSFHSSLMGRLSA